MAGVLRLDPWPLVSTFLMNNIFCGLFDPPVPIVIFTSIQELPAWKAPALGVYDSPVPVIHGLGDVALWQG